MLPKSNTLRKPPMPDRTDFSTIVFDVNETLLDIATLEPFFDRVFGNAAVLREWFPELILYSQTVTLSGLYAPFGDLAGGVLRMVGDNRNITIQDSDVSELKSLIGSMPAHADVAPALTKLRGRRRLKPVHGRMSYLGHHRRAVRGVPRCLYRAATQQHPARARRTGT